MFFSPEKASAISLKRRRQAAEVWAEHPLWKIGTNISVRPVGWIWGILILIVPLTVLGLIDQTKLLLNLTGYGNWQTVLNYICLALAALGGYSFWPMFKIVRLELVEATINVFAVFLAIVFLTLLFYLASFTALLRGAPLLLSYVGATQQEVVSEYRHVSWKKACRIRCGIRGLVGKSDGYYRMTFFDQPNFVSAIRIEDPNGYDVLPSGGSHYVPIPKARFEGYGNWFAIRTKLIEPIPREPNPTG